MRVRARWSHIAYLLRRRRAGTHAHNSSSSGPEAVGATGDERVACWRAASACNAHLLLAIVRVRRTNRGQQQQQRRVIIICCVRARVAVMQTRGARTTMADHYERARAPEAARYAR